MIAEITSKDELQTMAGKFKNVSAQFTTESAGVIGHLLDTEDFDGINISQAATAIQNNLKTISRDIEGLASRLNNYVADIKKIDTYDLNISEDSPALFLFEGVDSNSDNISTL